MTAQASSPVNMSPQKVANSEQGSTPVATKSDLAFRSCMRVANYLLDGNGRSHTGQTNDPQSLRAELIDSVGCTEENVQKILNDQQIQQKLARS